MASSKCPSLQRMILEDFEPETHVEYNGRHHCNNNEESVITITSLKAAYIFSYGVSLDVTALRCSYSII